MRVFSFDDEASWIEAASGELVQAAARARLEGRGDLQLCLAGGATPAALYAALARPGPAASALRGLSVELWLGDERAVPPEDPERNGAMAARAFSGAAWDPEPLLRPWPAGPAAEAAAAYAALLLERLGPRPAFDLAFLGLGADGHTASLFPGQAILGEESALAAASLAPSPPRERMSLTYPALLGSRRIRFLARGAAKAAVVAALEREEPALPASRLARSADAAVLYCGV